MIATLERVPLLMAVWRPATRAKKERRGVESSPTTWRRIEIDVGLVTTSNFIIYTNLFEFKEFCSFYFQNLSTFSKHPPNFAREITKLTGPFKKTIL